MKNNAIGVRDHIRGRYITAMCNVTSLTYSVVLSIILLCPLAATATDSTPGTDLNLSDNEQRWLASHPSVSFTGDPNWLPYEAFDSDGNYIGIVAEHLKLISATTGIEFRMNPSRTWTESTQKAKQGIVDILSETDDSDLKSHLIFTNHYLKNPIVIAMHSRENFVENIAAIKHR